MPDNPLDQAKNVQEILNNLNSVSTVMAATMGLLVDKEKQLIDIADSLGDKFEGIHTSAKRLVTAADASKKSFRDVLISVQAMSEAGIFSNKTLKNAKQTLEEMEKAAIRASRSLDYGSGGRIAAIKALEVIRKALNGVERQAKDAGRSLDDLCSPEMAKELEKAFNGAANAIGRIEVKAKSTNGIIWQTLSTVRQLGPLMKRLESIRRPEVTPERLGMFERNLARGGPSNAISGFLRAIPLNEKGVPDSRMMTAAQRAQATEFAKRITAKDMTNANLDEMAGQITDRKGIGGAIDRWRMRKAVKEAATNILAKGGTGEIGPSAETGLGRVVAGGSSWLGGMGEAVEGLGPGAIIGGSLLAMKKTFDAMVEDNKSIYDKLGGAGIMTHGGNAFEAFQNVRRNLTLGPNSYGQTRGENLRIAETINKFGVSVGDLAESGNNLNKNIVGYAGAGAGTNIAQTVHHAGAMLGMTDVETTDRMMKLMMQYHLSLKSTDTFFNTLIADTKAAGLSTAKYIQILDEITGQFDHMSRGIGAVTSALRNLGHTGLLTSEMVEDSMKAMMTQKNTPEMNTYLLMQMGPAERSAAFESMKQGTQGMGADALDAAEKAYMDSGKSHERFEADKAKWGVNERSLMTPKGATDLQRMLGFELTDKPGAVNVQKQNAMAAAAQLSSSFFMTNSMGAFAANPTVPNAMGVAYSARQTPELAAILNATAFLGSIQRAGGYDTQQKAYKAAIGGELDTSKNPHLAMILGALTSNGKTMDDMLNAFLPMNPAAGAQVGAAARGEITDEDAKRLFKYIPEFKEKAGKTPAQQVQEALKDSKRAQATVENLSTDPQAFRNYFSPNSAYSKSVTEQNRKAGEELKLRGESVGEALQSTDTILNNILDVLKMDIFGGLTALINFFVKPEPYIVNAINATGPGTMQGNLQKLQDELEGAKAGLPTDLQNMTAAIHAAQGKGPDSQEEKNALEARSKYGERASAVKNLEDQIATTKDLMNDKWKNLSTQERWDFDIGLVKEHQTAKAGERWLPNDYNAIAPAARAGAVGGGPAAEAVAASGGGTVVTDQSTKINSSVVYTAQQPPAASYFGRSLTDGFEFTPPVASGTPATASHDLKLLKDIAKSR